jgi:Uma2 family endonuclease
VAFVARAREEKVGDIEGFFPGAPDLAVEVLSSTDTYTEVEEKALAWLDGGTRMVVVVDPRKSTLTVYRSRSEITVLRDEEALAGGDVVPGWSLPVRNVFA